MKQIIKNSPLAISIFILGAAIIVAGILTMALYHDMSWQSYVIIGCLMISAIWAMLNLPVTVSIKHKVVPVRVRRR
ncbi:MAG: hypothetical protein J1E78_00435 [Muribaculaceae bacterium]|nr:hypothetical protein [Muribaculaceae bacterium]